MRSKVSIIEDMLDEDQKTALQSYTLLSSPLKSNLADTLTTLPTHESASEDLPILPDGTCSHPYLIPNLNKTSCILAQRIDIGKHYILTGGFSASKENYLTAVGRLISFGRYVFDIDEPVVSELFKGKKFRDAAKNTCPSDKQILDPFQFNIIIQLPGQTVAQHIDGVYFQSSDRFDIPQWLLASMKFSGIWDDFFIPQVQVVAYFHKWKWSEERGGEFAYWLPNENGDVGSATLVKPLSGWGSTVDGSRVVHAANTYYPKREPPLIDKSKDIELRYEEELKMWTVYEDGVRTIFEYDNEELRQTLVFRARCFESEEAKEKFKDRSNRLSLDDVISRLTIDLKSKGYNIPSSRLDLCILIMKVYIKYPYPSSIIPVNYCAAEKLLKQKGVDLKDFFDFIGCGVKGEGGKGRLDVIDFRGLFSSAFGNYWHTITSGINVLKSVKYSEILSDFKRDPVSVFERVKGFFIWGAVLTGVTVVKLMLFTGKVKTKKGGKKKKE
ncbi:hypothetical protein TL16_g07742 [Triparma laevis f. inornata]|uniref:Uncharacterized protein n=1 Tax=Triparma laevis f. inornata TaxID=1714386 RepID=A0A9W7AUV0_9STRA|nr:hypothetical protein TL16_g07742 [Triparma laevis f. inornata]